MIQLHNGRRQDYFQIPLPSSSHGYAGEWFYVRNTGDPPLANGAVLPPNYVYRAPVFTGVAPSKWKQWAWGRDKKQANQVDFILEKSAPSAAAICPAPSWLRPSSVGGSSHYSSGASPCGSTLGWPTRTGVRARSSLQRRFGLS
ncbi:hypothetical protein U9M48_039352 [Paspalum notatum var. saurae]|uniref:Uncharacterized protein n=1 Tax=Paspalum notatum var. saurae TaxID=547442 RepID=A0AAQ3UNE2_PASNO